MPKEKKMSLIKYDDYTNGSTYYPQGDWLGYVVYLDFGGLAVDGGGFPDGPSTVLDLFHTVAECLAPAGITVTNRYPYKLRRGEYTTIKSVPAFGLPGRSGNASGNSPKKQLRNLDWDVPCEVLVEIADVKAWGYTMAHEAVHAMTGLDTNHEDTPVGGGVNLMHSGTTSIIGGKLSPAFIKDIRQTVARIKNGDRFGLHYVPGTTSGQVTEDWFNIGAAAIKSF